MPDTFRSGGSRWAGTSDSLVTAEQFFLYVQEIQRYRPDFHWRWYSFELPGSFDAI